MPSRYISRCRHAGPESQIVSCSRFCGECNGCAGGRCRIESSRVNLNGRAVDCDIFSKCIFVNVDSFRCERNDLSCAVGAGAVSGVIGQIAVCIKSITCCFHACGVISVGFNACSFVCRRSDADFVIMLIITNHFVGDECVFTCTGVCSVNLEGRAVRLICASFKSSRLDCNGLRIFVDCEPLRNIGCALSEVVERNGLVVRAGACLSELNTLSGCVVLNFAVGVQREAVGVCTGKAVSESGRVEGILICTDVNSRTASNRQSVAVLVDFDGLAICLTLCCEEFRGIINRDSLVACVTCNGEASGKIFCSDFFSGSSKDNIALEVKFVLASNVVVQTFAVCADCITRCCCACAHVGRFAVFSFQYGILESIIRSFCKFIGIGSGVFGENVSVKRIARCHRVVGKSENRACCRSSNCVESTSLYRDNIGLIIDRDIGCYGSRNGSERNAIRKCEIGCFAVVDAAGIEARLSI